jgi:phosphohistidine phosphatase
VLEDYADAKSVAVVGHKPRLQELAAYLLTGEGDGMKIKIRQGSVTCIRLDGAPAPGTGNLHWLLTQKALRFLAGQHFG